MLSFHGPEEDGEMIAELRKGWLYRNLTHIKKLQGSENVCGGMTNKKDLCYTCIWWCRVFLEEWGWFLAVRVYLYVLLSGQGAMWGLMLY